MQFIKMSWMITWRMIFINAIFGLSLAFSQILLIAIVTAAILRYGMKISINTFPIIRLISKRKIITTHSNATDIDNKHSTITQPVITPSTEILDKASKNGRTTGFEPYNLDNLPIPSSVYMHGTPGIGLSSAKHMTNYSVKSGQMGETNFAKALSVVNVDGSRDYSGASVGLLDRVNSFWSVAMPSENMSHKADKIFNTDIDCIIVSGNNILLIDTKFYTSGDVTYTSSGDQLYCTDNSTVSMVKKPRKMTRNMEMALQRFQSHYPKMNVSAYVVMMPTNSGSATISNVFWPGRIPAVSIDQMIAVIHNLASTSGTKVYDYRTIPNISSLQKN